MKVDDIRVSMGLAYRYLLEDMEKDDSLAREWDIARNEVTLYGREAGKRGRWYSITDKLILDDLQLAAITKLFPVGVIFITEGYLGIAKDQANRVARELGLRILSDEVKVNIGQLVVGLSWMNRFNCLVDALGQRDQKRQLKGVCCVTSIIVKMSDFEQPVNAFVKNDILYVCGDPFGFAADATAHLVNTFQLGQRGEAVPYLTMALSHLENEAIFAANVAIVADNLDIEIDLTLGNIAATNDNSTEEEHAAEDSDDLEEDDEDADDSSNANKENSSKDHSGNNRSDGQSSKSGTEQQTGNNGPSSDSGKDKQSHQGGGTTNNHKRSGGSEGNPPTKPGDGKSNAATPHNKPYKKVGRMLSYVAGEITSSDDDYEIIDDESPAYISTGKAAELRAIEFEKDRGWNPVNMNDSSENYEGYDIESIGPDGRMIFIEVKGINGPWTNVGVGLSSTQFKYATKYKEDYYLYVVEYALSPGDAHVYRIENPAELVSKFQFDHGWKNACLAETETEEPKPVLHEYIGKRVKIISMGNIEGTVSDVKQSKIFTLLIILLDNGEETQKRFNPQDIKFI
jgi:hypothetical protein